MKYIYFVIYSLLYILLILSYNSKAILLVNILFAAIADSNASKVITCYIEITLQLSQMTIQILYPYHINFFQYRILCCQTRLYEIGFIAGILETYERYLMDVSMVYQKSSVIRQKGKY